jgi:hypothetical protein
LNRPALSLIITIAIVATACGGGGAGPSNAPTASAAPPDSVAGSAPSGAGSSSGPVDSTAAACDLLTSADIKELTDLDVDEAVPGPAMGVFENGCEWTLSGDAASRESVITLGVLAPGGLAMWERSFKPFGDEMGMTTIEGLGDEAQLGDVDDVIAVEGDTLVSLQFLGDFGMPEDLPVELTRRVLENLSAG